MAVTTISLDVTDEREEIVFTPGGPPGAKGITIIIDDTKAFRPLEIYNALVRAAQEVNEQWPIPSA